MATHDIVTIGASAGGIETLRRLLSMLPADLPAAIMVVQHLHPHTPSSLDQILARAGTLPVQFAQDHQRIEPGHVYLAPPDNHLLVEPARLRVVRGPRENRHRPAVDPLFRSAAWAYGPRVVGIVLSGTLDDGASGLWAVRSCGGTTIVQDPADALHAEMPTSALMTLNVDHCLPLGEIAVLLPKLARQEVNGRRPVTPPEALGLEVAVATREHDTDVEDMRKLGKPAGFTCPTCKGSLWELNEGELSVFRCHIGHAFAPDSLQAAQAEEVEVALESALRALEEQGAAARRLGDRLDEKVPALAARYDAQAAGLEDQAAVIRKLLRRGIKLHD
ncbi:MAG TPA: chemotaxis protein CheB [Gemmatimonadales bacterium]|nr:chemotaxis protein CheB [Hyphomicrobiaceae bacterium]HWC74030.1 chemotaxis protein CheB [Gemmatimonadales bacterium]